jgi:hypothetical protein
MTEPREGVEVAIYAAAYVAELARLREQYKGSLLDKYVAELAMAHADQVVELRRQVIARPGRTER